MSTPPANPRIYHITHVDNLGSIVAAGGLVSDATMVTSPSLVMVTLMKTLTPLSVAGTQV